MTPPVPRPSGSSPLATLGLALGPVVMLGALVLLVARSWSQPAAATGSGVTSPPGRAVATGGSAGTHLPPDFGILGGAPGDADEEKAPAPELPDALPFHPAGSVEPAETQAPLPIPERALLWGSSDALATATLFGDVGCPYTRSAYAHLRRLKHAYGPWLRLVWIHRPIPVAKDSLADARVVAAVRLAKGQTSGWRALDHVLRDEQPPESALLSAEEAGQGMPAVELDMVLAGQFGIRRTPTVYVNAAHVPGAVHRARLESAVQEEIAKAVALLMGGEFGNAPLYNQVAQGNFIGVGEVPSPRHCIEVTGSPQKGASHPLVTIVEVTDFDCEHCATGARRIERLLSRHRDEVALVHKNLPLQQHAEARAAADFAAAVFDSAGPSAFWRARQRLFAEHARLSPELYAEIAEDLGIDPDDLAMLSEQPHPRVDADIEAADELKVSGVPTYFINGRRVEGAVANDKLARLVREELRGARRLLARGIEPLALSDALCGRPPSLPAD